MSSTVDDTHEDEEMEFRRPPIGFQSRAQPEAEVVCHSITFGHDMSPIDQTSQTRHAFLAR
jgi:hypothetical protein